MTPENEDHQERDHVTEHEHDMQPARQTAPEGETEPQAEPEPEAQDVEKKSILSNVRRAYARARDGRSRASSANQDRNEKSRDRSKAFLLIAVSVFVMLFIFLAMFSHPSSRRVSDARRGKPSVGRPEQSAIAGQENRGSMTPLQSAEPPAQDSNGDQISPDDVRNTARMHMPPDSRKTLADVPPMDPALEKYREAKEGAPPSPPPPQPASAGPATKTHNESDALKKPSLVFVVSNSTEPQRSMRTESISTEPAVMERRTAGGLLPNGSRLVARFETAVSTAVKTPAVASIEYNYERGGEIVIPAGTKAFGELQQADRSGLVSVRFHSLQMPDGTADKIDGTAIGLDYGPMKGSVSGSQRGKRILVRSLTGVGTMAAYLVGGPGGFSAASGQLNNSVLLRERIASNAGLAGEQEMMSSAMNEQIAVTVPANTRFLIVLHEQGSEQLPSRVLPSGSGTQMPSRYAAAESALPSAAELRELIDLKRELNAMYRDVGATRSSEPSTVAGQQDR